LHLQVKVNLASSVLHHTLWCPGAPRLWTFTFAVARCLQPW